MENMTVPSFISGADTRIVTADTATSFRKVSGSNASTTLKVIENAAAMHTNGPTTTTTTTTTTTQSYTTTPSSLVKGEAATYSSYVKDGAQVVSAASVVSGRKVSTTQSSRAYQSEVGQGSSPSSVVRREYGEQRLVSVTERADETRSHVISERFVEHEVRIPKKIIREEIIEKVIVVPEKKIVEEVVEDSHKYREKVIEMAKPIIVEKVIEVPEVEYVERIVEVPTKEIREVVVEKVMGEPDVITREVKKRVPREVRVEVPEVIYRDVPQTKVVEVPEIVEEVVTVEKKVPKETIVEVPQERIVEVPEYIKRNLPIPVAVETEYEYRLPQLRPVYTKKTYPVYIPRFIEVPVPAEMLSAEMTKVTEAHLAKLAVMPKSLCELENTAAEIMKSNVNQELSTINVHQAIEKAWHSGTLKMTA